MRSVHVREFFCRNGPVIVTGRELLRRSIFIGFFACDAPLRHLRQRHGTVHTHNSKREMRVLLLSRPRPPPDSRERKIFYPAKENPSSKSIRCTRRLPLVREPMIDCETFSQKL